MKNRRAFLFSLVLGLAAVLMLAVYLSNVEKQFKGGYEEMSILVASRDILRYEVIDETMLVKQNIPKPYVQPLAVTAMEPEQVMGYMADSTIKKGEQITKTKLALMGEGGISPLIRPNYRACTIAVNEITGVAGLIRNRDSVDIVATFKTLDEKNRVANSVEAITLFQNVPILAVGRNYIFDRPQEIAREKVSVIPSVDRGLGFSNITLEMTPRQCMDLIVAQQVGELTVTLRSYHDRFTSKPNPELKDLPSTTASATGIRSPVEISKRPRWLELRGDQPILVP